MDGIFIFIFIRGKTHAFPADGIPKNELVLRKRKRRRRRRWGCVFAIASRTWAHRSQLMVAAAAAIMETQILVRCIPHNMLSFCVAIETEWKMAQNETWSWRKCTRKRFITGNVFDCVPSYFFPRKANFTCVCGCATSRSFNGDDNGSYVQKKRSEQLKTLHRVDCVALWLPLRCSVMTNGALRQFHGHSFGALRIECDAVNYFHLYLRQKSREETVRRRL